MTEYDDRRAKDRTNLKEEIDYLHEKLRMLSSAMSAHTIGAKEVEQTVKNITRGFENTIDSHREDLNRIGNKQSNLEREVIGISSSRRVLLVALGSFALITSGVAYDYFLHRTVMEEKTKVLGGRITKIEDYIKDWNGK